jgi:hypothetical protein
MTQARQWKNPIPEHGSELEPPADAPSQIKAGADLDCIKGIFDKQPVRESHRRCPASRVWHRIKQRDKSKGRQQCYAPPHDNLVSGKNER